MHEQSPDRPQAESRAFTEEKQALSSTPAALSWGGWGMGLSLLASVSIAGAAAESYDGAEYIMWAWIMLSLAGVFFFVWLAGLIVSAIRMSARHIVAAVAPTPQ